MIPLCTPMHTKVNGGRPRTIGQARPMTRERLKGSLICYAALAALALGLLRGPFLTVILIFLGGLAVKSWVAYKKERM